MQRVNETYEVTYRASRVVQDALSILRSRTGPGAELAEPAESNDFRHRLILELGGLNYEVFWITFLDTNCRVIESEVMFRGTLCSASVYPREVAKRALDLEASGVVLAHNHPSGQVEPSESDYRITERLIEVLDVFGIWVCDHLIVSSQDVLSMAQKGRVTFTTRH